MGNHSFKSVVQRYYERLPMSEFDPLPSVWSRRMRLPECFLFVSWAVLLLGLFGLSPAEALPRFHGPARIEKGRIELVAHGNFEQLAPGTKVVFGFHGPVLIVEDARSALKGKQFLRFAGPEKGDFSSLTITWPDNTQYASDGGRSREELGKIPVFREVVYRLEFWARGSGTLEPWVTRYQHGSFIVGGLARGRYALSGKWQKISLPYRLTPSNLSTHATLYFRLHGDKNSYADIDRFSFSCAADSKARELYFPTLPTARGQIRSTGAAELSFYHNGVSLDGSGGKFKFRVRPDMNNVVIAARGMAAPIGLSGEIEVGEESFSISDGSWLWTKDPTVAFDSDRFGPAGWKSPVVRDGALEIPSPGEDVRIYLRRSFYLPHRLDRFIYPKQPQFHIALNSVTLKTLMLVRMSPGDAGRVSIEVEVPEEIRLLPKEGGDSPWCNIVPEKMEESRLKRGRQRYRHYRIETRAFQKAKLAGGWLTLQNQIPLSFTLERMPKDRMPRYVRIRRIERGGNATELWYEEPVVFLPEPKGGRPEKLRFYYRGGGMWDPWYYPDMKHSKEERYRGLGALAAVGPGIFRVESEEWRKEVDRLGQSYTVPDFGTGEWSSHNCWALFFNDFPDYRAVRYRGRGDVFGGGWSIEHHGMCYTRMLTVEGKEAFRRFEMVLKSGLKGSPGARFVHEETATLFRLDACFCDLCKKELAAFRGKPELAGMTDHEIIKSHSQDYSRFLIRQIGRVRRKKREILNRHGVIYFIHDEGAVPFGAHQGFFENYARMGVCDTLDSNSSARPWLPSSLAGYGPLASEPSVARFRNALRASPEGKTSIGGAVQNHYGEYPQEFRNMVLRAAAMGRSGVVKFEIQPIQFAVGSFYYIAEATRIIEEIEPFLIEGERIDHEFETDDSDKELLAFAKDGRAMLLIFNDDLKPSRCVVNHTGGGRISGKIRRSAKAFKDQTAVSFTIPGKNVEVVTVTVAGGTRVAYTPPKTRDADASDIERDPWHHLQADFSDCDKPIQDLAKQLSSEKPGERAAAARALYLLGVAALPTLELLTASLKDDDGEVKKFAQFAIWRLGADAAAAVPALQKAYEAGSKEQKKFILRIFERMGPAAKAALPTIRSAMYDKDWNIHRRGFFAAAKLGASAKPLVPIILDILRETNDSDLFRQGMTVLASIGQDARSALPALRKALRGEEPYHRLNSSNTMWAMSKIGGLTKEDLTFFRARQKEGNIYAGIALRNLSRK